MPLDEEDVSMASVDWRPNTMLKELQSVCYGLSSNPCHKLKVGEIIEEECPASATISAIRSILS